MTAWLRVDSIAQEPGSSRFAVHLSAATDRVVQPWKDDPAMAYMPREEREREITSLSANTEGDLRRAELTLWFEGDEAPLEVGQFVYLGGHFTAKVTAAEPTGSS